MVAVLWLVVDGAEEALKAGRCTHAIVCVYVEKPAPVDVSSCRGTWCLHVDRVAPYGACVSIQQEIHLAMNACC
jgi:hypothetical protein